MMDFEELCNQEFNQLLEKGEIEEARLSDEERETLMKIAKGLARDKIHRGVDYL